MVRCMWGVCDGFNRERHATTIMKIPCDHDQQTNNKQTTKQTNKQTNKQINNNTTNEQQHNKTNKQQNKHTNKQQGANVLLHSCYQRRHHYHEDHARRVSIAIFAGWLRVDLRGVAGWLRVDLRSGCGVTFWGLRGGCGVVAG